MKSVFCVLAVMAFLSLVPMQVALGEENLSPYEEMVVKTAIDCRDEVIQEFELMLQTNALSLGQLFDTFYVPIPDTNPQQFSTQYDRQMDNNIRIIIDKYLKKDPHFIFVVAVDINGYVPTHNSKYTRPLTGNLEIDSDQNRTKRIFDDRTGLAAAKNKAPFLVQHYQRDTGEKMLDVSVPILIHGKHWGAIRIGCNHE